MRCNSKLKHDGSGSKGNRELPGMRKRSTQLAEPNPKDLTIVLTLSAKILEVIFLPGM